MLWREMLEAWLLVSTISRFNRKCVQALQNKLTSIWESIFVTSKLTPLQNGLLLAYSDLVHLNTVRFCTLLVNYHYKTESFVTFCSSNRPHFLTLITLEPLALLPMSIVKALQLGHFCYFLIMLCYRGLTVENGTKVSEPSLMKVRILSKRHT